MALKKSNHADFIPALTSRDILSDSVLIPEFHKTALPVYRLQKMFAFLVLPVILALVAYFYFDLPDKEYTGSEYVRFHPNLEKISSVVPSSSFNGNDYAFGRYRAPIKDFSMHVLTPFQQFSQLKEFAYTAVTDKEWFIGSALLQFHYNAAAIVYVFNTKTNVSHIHQLELPLIGEFFGAKFDANSSAISGCVAWNNGVFDSLVAKKCFNPATKSYDVSLSGKFPSGGPKYDIQYSMSLQGEAMSLVFPLGPKRPSLVTKFAGTAVSHARLTLNGHTHVLKNPLGMMDWTRGLLRRLTYWHWLAMSWADNKGNTFGLQLSEGTYDNDQSVSLESTLWMNSKASHVNSKIIFTQLNKAVKAFESDWKVESEDSSIQLTFRFANVIKGSFHYGILDGDLFHMWGLYSGTIRHNGELIQVNDVPGTLEDHYALW